MEAYSLMSLVQFHLGTERICHRSPQPEAQMRGWMSETLLRGHSSPCVTAHSKWQI